MRAFPIRTSPRGALCVLRALCVLHAQVQGALVIRAAPGAKVHVGALAVRNAGWAWQPLAEGQPAKEEERIR